MMFLIFLTLKAYSKCLRLKFSDLRLKVKTKTLFLQILLTRFDNLISIVINIIYRFNVIPYTILILV